MITIIITLILIIKNSINNKILNVLDGKASEIIFDLTIL